MHKACKKAKLATPYQVSQSIHKLELLRRPSARRHPLTVSDLTGFSSAGAGGGFLTVTGRASATQSPDIKINADSFKAIMAFTNVNT